MFNSARERQQKRLMERSLEFLTAATEKSELVSPRRALAEFLQENFVLDSAGAKRQAKSLLEEIEKKHRDTFEVTHGSKGGKKMIVSVKRRVVTVVTPKQLPTASPRSDREPPQVPLARRESKSSERKTKKTAIAYPEDPESRLSLLRSDLKNLENSPDMRKHHRDKEVNGFFHQSRAFKVTERLVAILNRFPDSSGLWCSQTKRFSLDDRAHQDIRIATKPEGHGRFIVTLDSKCDPVDRDAFQSSTAASISKRERQDGVISKKAILVNGGIHNLRIVGQILEVLLETEFIGKDLYDECHSVARLR